MHTRKKLSYEHLTVFAGLNQVSAGLNRFKPHVWQKPNADLITYLHPPITNILFL